MVSGPSWVLITTYNICPPGHISGQHSNQNQVWCVNIGKCTFLCPSWVLIITNKVCPPGNNPGQHSVLFIYFFNDHFHFPVQLVGGFTLSDLLDKPWSQVPPLFPPGTCLQFLSRIGFSIPTARRFSSNVTNSRSRAFR